MMRIFSLTKILPFVVFIGSCIGQNPNVKTKKNYQIENIEQVSIQDLESNIDSILSMPKRLTSETFYHSNGQEAKRISYSNGEASHIAKYQYDDLGNITEWIGESNSFKFRWIYYYNSQGENYRDEKYHGELLDLRYEYELENGNIIAKHCFDSDGRNFWSNHYTYDLKGRKTSYKMTHLIKEQEEFATYNYNEKENSMTEEMYDYNNKLRWKAISKYNEHNERIETISFNENNEIVRKTFLNYNSNIDLVEIKSYNNNNEQLGHTRYIRKYDNRGNEILNAFILDNIIKSIDIYEFEYYN